MACISYGSWCLNFPSAAQPLRISFICKYVWNIILRCAVSKPFALPHRSALGLMDDNIIKPATDQRVCDCVCVSSPVMTICPHYFIYSQPRVFVFFRWENASSLPFCQNLPQYMSIRYTHTVKKNVLRTVIAMPNI